MLYRITIGLSLLLITVGCGAEEPEDLTEPTCWTENGSFVLYWDIPSGTEASEELEDTCKEIHDVHNS